MIVDLSPLSAGITNLSGSSDILLIAFHSFDDKFIFVGFLFFRSFIFSISVNVMFRSYVAVAVGMFAVLMRVSVAMMISRIGSSRSVGLNLKPRAKTVASS